MFYLFINVPLKALIGALEVNNVIEMLEVRETDITNEQLVKINKALLRNRTGIEDNDIEQENYQSETEIEVIVSTNEPSEVCQE